MKKIIVLFLFFPFFCFGQEYIDPYNEDTIDYHFEENPPTSLIEGKWMSRLGHFYVTKGEEDTFYLIGAGYSSNLQPSSFSYGIQRSRWKNYIYTAVKELFAGDTIGVFKQRSHRRFTYKGKVFNNGGDFIGVVEGFNKKYDKQIYTSDTEIEVILLTPNTRHIYFKTLNEKKQEDIQSYSNNNYIKYLND